MLSIVNLVKSAMQVEDIHQPQILKEHHMQLKMVKSKK